MKIVYFSPNDTTRTVTEAAAAAMEPGGERVDLLKAPLTEDLSVGAEEMLVVGMPVYAGRIPALCLSSLAHLKGNGGPAAAIAVYGNRDYDDALLELTDLLEAQGFRVWARAPLSPSTPFSPPWPPTGPMRRTWRPSLPLAGSARPGGACSPTAIPDRFW